MDYTTSTSLTKSKDFTGNELVKTRFSIIILTFHIFRHLREGEILYYGVGARNSSSMTGTERDYSGRYTFNYREEINKSRSEKDDSGTNQTEEKS